MADSKTTFYQRVASALFAVGMLFCTGYWGGALGLQVISGLAIALGMREYARMTFQSIKAPRSIEFVYWLVALGIFYFLLKLFSFALLGFTLGFLVFFISTLWLARGKVSNPDLLSMLSMGGFGLIYCLLFPFFVLQLASLEEGPHWFALLMLTVFFGDTFAYFGGRWFGRHKMMPNISPNKTWQGSASGIMGSCLAGMVYLYSSMSAAQEGLLPIWLGLAFCISCAIAAQTGDLTVSLVKRVYHVKDSGHIMPGHGGILDRLDGIYMAAPVVYTFALYVTHQF